MARSSAARCSVRGTARNSISAPAAWWRDRRRKKSTSAPSRSGMERSTCSPNRKKGSRGKPHKVVYFFLAGGFGFIVCLRWNFLRPRWWRIVAHAIEQPDRLQDHIAADLEAFDAEFVQGIFGRVMKAVIVAVSSVDDIGYWNVYLNKRKMIILDCGHFAKEKRLISQPCGSLQDHVFQPGS